MHLCSFVVVLLTSFRFLAGSLNQVLKQRERVHATPRDDELMMVTRGPTDQPR